jgi:hypothetical protein
MPSDDELERTEIEAVLETRRELGLRYDAELVDGFADRIERAVDRRVAEELASRRRRDAASAAGGPRQLALAIVSLVAFIPISIALSVNNQYLPLLVTLLAILGLNLTHAWQSKR